MEPIKIGSVSQMIDDMKNGVYDFTENGECSNCGSCCSNILPITVGEEKRIRAYMKSHSIKEQKRLFPTAMPIFDMTCPFRNNAERKCEIYEVRPAICRDFRCDKPQKGSWGSKDLLNRSKKYRVVEMRKMFFG